MKRFSLLLMAVFISALIFQSCEDDQSSLADPRDAIAKEWRVVEYESTNKLAPPPERTYFVTISKDPSDITKIWLDNFYDLGEGVKISATFASNVIKITNQVAEGYTINGEGTVLAEDNIKFDFSVTDPDEITTHYTAEFGEDQSGVKKLLQ